MPTIPSRPSGTVTFLFTDIERTTGAKDSEQTSISVRSARAWQEIVQSAIEANGGYLYKKAGDAWQAAFSTADGAVQAALDAQRALNSKEKGEDGAFVKMALHTGVTEERGDDYVGPLLNRAARLLAAGHGGQVLLTRAAATLAQESLPRGVTLRDLGEHRLKDLLLPEQVYQLAPGEDGIPSEFPPLKTLESRPNNLPLQPTPFLGREREVAEVGEILRRDEVGLLTLTGPGGIGKTRLALQVAADIVDEFEDGVFFVPLAAINDPDLVAPSIAQAIGVREEGGQDLLDTLKDYFQSRHLLLVLDNFEQVLDAGIQVSGLLSSAARLKVLATSRASLHLSMEQEYQVPPLRVPDPKAVTSSTVEALTQYESVELFIRRAQAANPGFAVNNQNAPAVAEICYRLEGIPLAIELAAARTKLLAPAALLAKLDSRLRLLTGGAREAHSRQQTLRNTIDWSYDLLTDGEKQLFRRVAVFRGGWSFDAAESVCDADGNTSPGAVPPLEIDVLDGITSLVDKSLVYVAGGNEGEPRYRTLETINEYASEKLKESGEAAVLERGHAFYFMGLAEEAEPYLTGARQGEWLDRLEEDQDNIRAVLKWATSEPGDDDRVEVGLRVLGAIWRFWVVRGYLSGVREQMEALLRSDGGAQAADREGRHRARALTGLGAILFTHGDPGAARPLLEESLAINRQLGDKAGMAASLNLLGNMSYEQGDYEGARALHQESLALKREIGDKRGIAVSFANLANVAYELGELDTARSLHEQSLEIHREISDKWVLAISLGNLGNVAQEQGDYAGARAAHEESLAISRELNDPWGISTALNNLGISAQDQGDYAAARAAHEESLAIKREVGDRKGISITLTNLGYADLDEGHYEPALAQLREGLAMQHGLGITWAISTTLTGLGTAEVLGSAEGQLRGVERGVRLLGAVAALLETTRAVLESGTRATYERGVEAGRAKLGEEAFEKAWEEGRAMSMEEAVAYALRER